MFRARRIGILASVAILTTGIGQVLSVSAAAAASPPGAAAGPGAYQSCTYSTSTRVFACYATFRDAIAAISHGRVTDITDPTKVTEEDALRISTAGAGIQVDVLLGILYQHAQYGGATLVAHAASGCDSNQDTWEYWYPSMPSGWNNIISSFTGYSGCEIKIYDATNANCFSGPCMGPLLGISYVGDTMNDKTSSVTFH